MGQGQKVVKYGEKIKSRVTIDWHSHAPGNQEMRRVLAIVVWGNVGWVSVCKINEWRVCYTIFMGRLDDERSLTAGYSVHWN